MKTPSYPSAPRSPARRQALASAGALAASLALPSRVRAAGEPPLKTVVVSEAVHLGMYASVYAAKYGGYFAKHGIDLSLSAAGGLALPVPILLSGRATIAVTGAGMSVNATREGARLVNIAKIVGGVAMWAVGKPGTAIKSMEDLRGKTIATLRFPSSTIQIPTFAMKRAGIDPAAAGVKFLELPPGAQAQAVLDGRADFATMFEWDVSISKQQFGLEALYTFNDVIGPLAWTTAMVERSTIDKDPATLQAFCDAIAEAQAAIQADRELFIKTSIVEFPQATEPVIRSAANHLLLTTAIPKTPTISKAEWDVDMAMEIQAGSIKSALPYEQMVDNSFAEKAVAKLKKAS